MDPIKALRQTAASLQLMAKKTEKEYFGPAKGYEFLYIRTPPDCLVVSAAEEQE